MIKTLLIVGIIVVATLIGFAIKSHFSIRYSVFDDFKDMVSSLKSEICFLKSDKFSFLKNYRCKSKVTQDFIDKYVAGEKCNIRYLKEEEKDELVQLLDNIGKRDVDGEIYNLDYYYQKISKHCDISQDQLSRYGLFSIKISIIIGVLIAIILI